MSNKVYLVRGKAEKCLRDNLIAVDCPEVFIDLKNYSRSQLKSLLEERTSFRDVKLGSCVSSLFIFVNRLTIGDLVVLPAGQDIHLGRVDSEYIYDENKGSLAHYHRVVWLKTVRRKYLSLKLRNTLKNWHGVVDISRFYSEIDDLINDRLNKPKEIKTRFISFSLRDDYSITYRIPSDMTRDEAKKLKAFFGAQQVYLSELYSL